MAAWPGFISPTASGPSSVRCYRPPARTGRPRADDRRTIEGILFVLITGCRWQDLPREYGAPTTAWRRLKRWGEEGVWERIWRAA
jgi:transposase